MKNFTLLALLPLAACVAPHPNSVALDGAALPNCKPAGCSGQLCVDTDGPSVASTCEWRQAYACYQSAKCEIQPDGKCGWTPTPELELCLEEAKVFRP